MKRAFWFCAMATFFVADGIADVGDAIDPSRLAIRATFGLRFDYKTACGK